MIRKAEQILMVGFEGTEVSSELEEDLRQDRWAGVILFSRNLKDPDQAARLCRRIRSLNPRTLIGIDQEGGRVQRLRHPFPELPPMAKVGATRRKTVARAAGRLVASALRAVGVHLNFAPVLDVASRPDNPVIGDRSLGADPHLVSRLGAAFIDGHQSEGVAACAKHFPGHGDTKLDSHLALPEVLADLDVLRTRELVPFRAAVAADVAAVMTAHVRYPSVDPAVATLSARWLKEELRGELRFPGLVVSDDLQMKALRDGPAPAAVHALAAGCDLLLVCSARPPAAQVAEALVRGAGGAELSELRLDAAWSRVQQFKSQWIPDALGPEPSAAQWAQWEAALRGLETEWGPAEPTMTSDPTEGPLT